MVYGATWDAGCGCRNDQKRDDVVAECECSLDPPSLSSFDPQFAHGLFEPAKHNGASMTSMVAGAPRTSMLWRGSDSARGTSNGRSTRCIEHQDRLVGAVIVLDWVGEGGGP